MARATSRPKNRVQILAEVHDKLRDLHGSLKDIDLRELRGNPQLREDVKQTRLCIEDAIAYAGEAIQIDLPEAV